MVSLQVKPGQKIAALCTWDDQPAAMCCLQVDEAQILSRPMAHVLLG